MIGRNATLKGGNVTRHVVRLLLTTQSTVVALVACNV